jgi:lipopolysaccharide export LptBFGC system permease protein LptF
MLMQTLFSSVGCNIINRAVPNIHIKMKTEIARMSEFFEALMVVCFGISWPASISKSIKSKTSRGKSLVFMCFVLVGYGFGIVSKLVSGNITYVFIFYVLNFVMVAVDIILYFRNCALDRKRT